MAVQPIDWQEQDGLIRLELPGELDLGMAAPLVDSLRHGLASGRQIEVKAEAVDRISTACLQALVAASRQAAEGDQEFSLVAPSAAMIESCGDLGLDGWLERWSKE